MTRSTLPALLWAKPLESLRQPTLRPMQLLHLNAASLPTQTSAPGVRSYVKCTTPSTSWLGPYISREYWLLTNQQGQYLADLVGLCPRWVASLNQVPDTHRYLNRERAMTLWKWIRSNSPVDNEGIAVWPFTFYAHRSTPHIWCALDD